MNYIILFIGTCDGGIFTYEKTTGHFLRTAQQEPLVLETQAPGITLECSNLCSNQGKTYALEKYDQFKLNTGSSNTPN